MSGHCAWFPSPPGPQGCPRPLCMSSVSHVLSVAVKRIRDPSRITGELVGPDAPRAARCQGGREALVPDSLRSERPDSWTRGTESLLHSDLLLICHSDRAWCAVALLEA